jgi:capsular exopolysaccharide synthesis family protein
MSKTYEALLRAEREQADHKKGTVRSEPVSKPQVEEPKTKAGHGKHPLNVFFEIGPKQGPISPEVHHERIIGRVSVGNFIGKLDSIFTEQFRKLKSVVITHNTGNALRSILVTSCIPQEGKTTVALNLSATIATGLDHSAILIDADLRKRTLTALLGLENTLGLSDVLEKRAGIEEAIIDTEIKGLTILPAGSESANPAELIGSIRMKDLIQQLGERCKDSYIIIDSPPIVSTSEANALVQMSDGAIVVIMADKTRRDVVKRELGAVSSEKILGVVLNCAEFEACDYYHKYYRHYGKKKD